MIITRKLQSAQVNHMLVRLVLMVAVQNDRSSESDLHDMKVRHFSVKCICHKGVWGRRGRPIPTGVQMGALLPITDLAGSTENLKNIRDKHTDEK
jgi:hypothetical protein